MKNLILTSFLFFTSVFVNKLSAQIYVDFQNAIYYTAQGDNLTSSGQTLASFDYTTAQKTHPIFNDGVYFALKDYSDHNLWIRVRHLRADPNGPDVGSNISYTLSSPFRSEGFGGWWGFLYEFDIYNDINQSGLPGDLLNGLSPVNITVESIETLSSGEWVSLQSLNAESSNWVLNSKKFSGNNSNSNPGFSATNQTYSDPGYSSNFPISKTVNTIDMGSSPEYAEFRITAENVSQFTYGYEYTSSGGYQGIRLYIGTPPVTRPVNDDCENALTLIPSANSKFNATPGTLTAALTSSSLDCDSRQTYDVWYNFIATAKYHRILLNNANLPESTRFQLLDGNCNVLHNIDCVLNSEAITVYDATDLTIGTTYYIKVYSPIYLSSDNNFDIGVYTPLRNIDKNMNLLTNGSFENPVQPGVNNEFNVGRTFNGWASLGNTGDFGIARVDIYSPGAGTLGSPDTAKDGMQYLDLLGFNETLYQDFTLAEETTLFFSGHFSNQLISQAGYVGSTMYCGIMDENGVLVAQSNIMAFDKSLSDKIWYQLSGFTTLTAGNYKYIAYMGDYAVFDNAFVQKDVSVNSLSIATTKANSSKIYAYQKIVYIELPMQSSGTVYIYNITGQLIKISTTNEGLNKIELSTTGLYFVKLLYGNNITVKKVILQ